MSRKRALVCTPMMPEPDRESGSRRIWNLIEYLVSDGFEVTVLVRDSAGGERARRVLNQRGIQVYREFNSRTAELIALGQFDLAIAAFWWIGSEIIPLIRALSPATRIVLDTIDIHFLREARFLTGPGARLGLEGFGRDFGNTLVRELNTYLMADVVMTVSRKEAALLDDFIGAARRTTAVPDAETLDQSPHGFDQRRGILFLGNFRHPPNPEALEFLFNDVLPLVDPALLAEHPVQIVGNALECRHAELLGESTGAKMIGWVPSVVPYLEQARIMVAPLLHGAGTKRKLIQAMMIGTPSVTTSIGAEGLGIEDGVDAVVRDNPAEFAAAIERLLTDEAAWSSIAGCSRARILETHGEEPARAAFLRLVNDLLQEDRPARVSSDGSKAVPLTSSTDLDAFIVASPNPVVGWPTAGAVTISWNCSSPSAFVTITSREHHGSTYSVGSSGTQVAPWIHGGEVYEFRLMAEPGATIPLATARVIGVISDDMDLMERATSAKLPIVPRQAP